MIGTIYTKEGSGQVDTNTYGTICSISIPSGTYIIIGHVGVSEVISTYNVKLTDGRTVRSPGTNGGGVITAAVHKYTSQTNIKLEAYNFEGRKITFNGFIWCIRII